jgi:hypothetical protein
MLVVYRRGGRPIIGRLISRRGRDDTNVVTGAAAAAETPTPAPAAAPAPVAASAPVAAPAPVALELRSPYLGAYPPPLLTPYVHAAVQVLGVLLSGALGVLFLANLRRGHPLVFGACGIALVAGAVGGAAACGMLACWSRVRWEWIHRAQRLFVAGASLVPLTCCLAGGWGMYAGVIGLPLTLHAWFALAYVESRPFRTACAWRTSAAWREFHR